jgi:hypothetical protein
MVKSAAARHGCGLAGCAGALGQELRFSHLLWDLSNQYSVGNYLKSKSMFCKPVGTKLGSAPEQIAPAHGRPGENHATTEATSSLWATPETLISILSTPQGSVHSGEASPAARCASAFER